MTTSFKPAGDTNLAPCLVARGDAGAIKFIIQWFTTHELRRFSDPTRPIRNTLLIALTALLFSIARAQDTAAAKPDSDRLQGEWTMISGERDGQPFPPEFLAGSRRIVKGDETTVFVRGTLFMKATFKVDPAKTPKTIDYTITGGNYAGNQELGIYKFEGDHLKFCFATPGKDRPSSFTTASMDGRTMSVWQPANK